jgi:O-antigen/teichoic acid export membrane protein
MKLIINRFSNSPKAQSLFKNSLWSIFGAIISKGLLFISWIIVARILGSDGYGQFGIIRSTVLMFTSFAGFSLGITASKHVAEFIDENKIRTGKIIGLTMAFGIAMGLIVGILFYFAAPWLAIHSLKAPEIIDELKIGALILFFSSLNGAQVGALQGFMAFKVIAKINIIQSFVSVPLFILGAYYMGVNGTIWAFAFSYVFICILSYFSIKREAKSHKVQIQYVNSWSEKGILFNYSLPSFLGGIMVTPIKWISDSILVSSSGFSEMGLFTAALTFNNIILVGAGMMSAPFISIMARDKNDDKNSKFSRFNIIAPWAIGVFIASPFLMFPELGSYLFGESFAGKSFQLTFVFVLLFTIVIMFKQGLARLLIVHNLQWWGVWDNLLWGSILIIGFVFYPEKSANVLASWYLVAYVINTIAVLPIYYKKRILPKNIIESKEAIGIWLLVFLTAGMGMVEIVLVLKIVIYLIVLILSFLLFKRLLNQSSTIENKY